MTILGSALPFLQAFLGAQRAHGDNRLFPAVRACINGGAPLPKDVHEEIRVAIGGVGVVNSYGLTEFPVATSGTVDDPDELLGGTAGRMGPGVELRIVDLGGREVGPGKEGELRWRGPQRSSGYADATLDADAFDELGYFRSGDLGMISSDGYVTVTGRVKDIIIRGAENISATELGDLLHQHPAVADVAVIGVSDLRMGERVCAIVQVEVGGPAVSLDDLRGFSLIKVSPPRRLQISSRWSTPYHGRPWAKSTRSRSVRCTATGKSRDLRSGA